MKEWDPLSGKKRKVRTLKGGKQYGQKLKITERPRVVCGTGAFGIKKLGGRVEMALGDLQASKLSGKSGPLTGGTMGWKVPS